MFMRPDAPHAAFLTPETSAGGLFAPVCSSIKYDEVRLFVKPVHN